MAKLYRRVPRFPHRHGALAFVLVTAVALGVGATSRASAQAPASEPEVAASGDPRLVRVESLLAELRSSDEGRRRAAYDALTTLGEDLLPAIRARIAHVRRHRPDANRAYDVFSRIRRAAGSTRADDDVDIAPGVLVVLREDRTDRVMQMVEPLLLWRALERLATFEAGQAMYPLIGLDGDLWRWEERRVVTRMGKKILAAAIAGRGHPDRVVRDWASATVRRLDAEEPGLAVQELEPATLADVLRAFAMVRMQSAMRVIVSYVSSERRGVRRAARWALEQYGGNAIWVLRTEYRNRTGERAPEQWGWRRLTEALYAHIDAQRMEPVRQAREAGLAAFERGQLEEARRQLADVLARSPDVESPRPLAEAYAAMAAVAVREGQLDRAEEDYRRALRLDPEHPEAARWRIALGFVDAEHSRAEGVIDTRQYAAVLAADPEHEGARRALGVGAGSPTRSEAAPAALGRWPLWAALGLLALGAALLLLRRRGPRAANAVTSDSSDELADTLESPTFDEAEPTLAESTLPG